MKLIISLSLLEAYFIANYFISTEMQRTFYFLVSEMNTTN